MAGFISSKTRQNVAKNKKAEKTMVVNCFTWWSPYSCFEHGKCNANKGRAIGARLSARNINLR
jgi:hypothetical protein